MQTGDPKIIALAQQGFLDGLTAGCFVAAGVALVGAVLTARYLPAQPSAVAPGARAPAPARHSLPAMSKARPPLALGVLAAVAAVAAITGLVYPLKEVAPVASLGVVYLVAVLLVSSVWGGALGVGTAVAGAAAFNFFHLPPTGRFEIEKDTNWVALAVYLIAAIVVSTLAEHARHRSAEAEKRRREADLAAELARLLLRGEALSTALPIVSHRLAAALDLPSAVVELGDPPADDPRHVRFPLREGPSEIGSLVLPADTDETTLARVQQRVIVSLEALLAAALERDRLQSDVVETAALRRSDVLKTALLRAVGHDLRSPLTAILTSAAALQSDRLSREELLQLTGGIEKEADRLARLIDDLLDLSRLEADAADPQPQWCDVEELLRAAAADTGAGEDAFHFVIAGDLPPLRADAAQIERAFANLITNALRFAGGHPVYIRARSLPNRVAVRIVDRGPGIPPAQRERIFDPFYQAPGERRGSGLGLAIVRGFVEVNGGKVWVESLPGQTTTFVVELPLEPAAAAA